MLEKLKFFNKDKDRSKSHTSKRTSSSSVFSSARSDSSLSLNNDPGLPAPPKSKKTDTANCAKASAKTSKLVSSKGVKEASPLPPPALKAPGVKSEKKDKVKTVEINVENLPTKNGLTVKFQKPPQIMIPNQKQQLLRKIEMKPDAKPPQLQPKSIMQPGTSIPKPMAAIKGQTKQVEFRKDEQFESIKGNHHNSSISLDSDQKTLIVNPLRVNNQLVNQNGIHASSKSMTDSLHSSSTNNHSNSSDSSVIYRPSASDSGSEFYHSNGNPIPNRKLNHFNDPLQANGYKFNTIPSKLNGNMASNGQLASTIFEEKQQGAAVSLKSIMRNYNNHVTLPRARGGQHLVNGYYEESSNQGYCSDGSPRKTPIRYTDIENGYLSDSGGVTNPAFMSIFRNRPQLPTTIEER